MFTSITLKNFRTHLDTTLELGSVVLLIGANNAGKSNLLAGINHFSRLAARGRPPGQTAHRYAHERCKLAPADFFPHRHRRPRPEDPMVFACTWQHKLGRVEYQIELYEHEQNKVGCRERISIEPEGSEAPPTEFSTGWDAWLDEVRLQTTLVSQQLSEREKELVGRDATERGYNTQFIVTSHSPSVLREFADHLDAGFYVRLDRKNYRSVATSLNTSLAAFVNLGTVAGEFEDSNGKTLVHITPEVLTNLWYSGIIGGEVER